MSYQLIVQIDTTKFRTFHRNLFHGSLHYILESLRPVMTVPEVTLFTNGHYRRVIYGLGRYITDYPEQVLLACTVQGWCACGPGGRRCQEHTEALFEVFDHKTLWEDYGVIPNVLPVTWTFPRADINEVLSPDLLHQVIEGTIKDHLVAWAGEYLDAMARKPVVKSTSNNDVIGAVARLESGVPQAFRFPVKDCIAGLRPSLFFPGLRRFPEGRGFQQWTDDNSKAIMKVYLPAIKGHIPAQMLRAFSMFLGLCYPGQRNVIDEATLVTIDAALARYHEEWKIFEETEFGAPNGLCSPMTESKHIKAVKELWRRSSRYEALHQMLILNEHLDKLAAARVNFIERGMLSGPAAHAATAAPPPAEDEDDDVAATDDRHILGETVVTHTILIFSPILSIYLLSPPPPPPPPLIRRFLYSQDHPDLDIPLADVPLEDCPDAPSKVKVFLHQENLKCYEVQVLIITVYDGLLWALKLLVPL
ncbi:hypothetical protein C8R43DRAFT_1120867 [Mycena crocata]|nr:hypothetical protein C8R43DRAFT_1120867 [Mycena crocata]